jgi:hypothetical protein
MSPFTIFDDEVLPLEEILELVDYEENNPEESFFMQQGNLVYRQFLAKLANYDKEDSPVDEKKMTIASPDTDNGDRRLLEYSPETESV